MGTVLLNNGQHIDFEVFDKKGYRVKVYYKSDDNPIEEYMTKTQLSKLIKAMLKPLKEEAKLKKSRFRKFLGI